MLEKNDDRHLELSSKFMQMGDALLIEGREKNDYVISQSGIFFILLSGLILDEEDVFLFSEMCSMFSAKKVLENMRSENLLGGSPDESYGDIIKRLAKLRGGEDKDKDDK